MRVLLGLAAVAALLWPGGARAADERAVEYDLALIERGTYVAPNDPLVRRYALVLDQLEDRCDESRSQLGQYAVNGMDFLAQQGGMHVTPLWVLLDLREAVPIELVVSNGHTFDCKEVLTIVLALEVMGQ
jgi:hypothetical protein